MHALVAHCTQPILRGWLSFCYPQLQSARFRWSVGCLPATCWRGERWTSLPKTLIGLNGRHERNAGQKSQVHCVCITLFVLPRREMVIIVSAPSYCAQQLHMTFKCSPNMMESAPLLQIGGRECGVGRGGGGRRQINKECVQVQHSSLMFEYPLRFPSIV